MSTATVRSKPEITIPADVRQTLQVEAGDRVEFLEVEPGRFEVAAATRSVTELKGMFGKSGKTVSIEEMNRRIAARWASARWIGIDTNVLVHYIMQDDAKQSPHENKLMEALAVDAPGFVSQVSIIELVGARWQLRADSSVGRAALDALLRTKEVVIDRADQVMKALRAFNRGSVDIADCLIESTAESAGCEKTVTFDVRTAKSAGMTLIS
jgi:AbrB family looped-hinge helix DNA binding protein